MGNQWSYFDSNNYDSVNPESNAFKKWAFQDNWFYFLSKYMMIVFRTRREALRNEYGKKEWADSSFEIFRLIEKIDGRFHITGMENIVKNPDPVVFISNHISTLETMIFPSLIAPRRDVTFVVKDTLVKHPLFGPVMRSREPIIVGRTDARKDFETVMTKGLELLSRGISIVVFPQSTRSDVFIPVEFNSIGVKLAKKAGVKVIPVAIKTDFWGNGKIIKEIGPLNHLKPVMIKFGEPFSVEGNGKEENQKIIDFIIENLKIWGGQIG
jgi:1-acyl-sn-glycerol-3-phosphate acyltransferase